MNEVGVGTRVVNFLIDTILTFLMSYGLYKWYTFYVMYWEFIYYPWYLFFYASVFVYYTFFESIWARTPGKWFSMSKVINANGGKPAFYQVIARSLIRLTIIDCLFIPFFDRTLHDQLTKTKVVEV
jgi:uncharacterized RDD family membrane protein YckC